MAAKPATTIKMDSGCTFTPKIFTVSTGKIEGICKVWLPHRAWARLGRIMETPMVESTM